MELLFIDDLQAADPMAIAEAPATEGANTDEAPATINGTEDSAADGPTDGQDADSEETTTTQVAANSGGEAVDTTETQPAGSPWPFWIMIGAMILIMYFFMWRPERKRRKQMEEFRNGLKKGDKIITAGGIYGTIKEVHETSLLIEIEGNVTLRIDKNMVVSDPSKGTAR